MVQARWRATRSSSPWPIPTPRSLPEEAKAARADAIMATGRSDYPNQVNNVLGFPFIFRGRARRARDADQRGDEDGRRRARWPSWRKEDVPDAVGARLRRSSASRFGRDYIIPKPFDPRVLLCVAPAVAKAAMDTGVARHPIATSTPTATASSGMLSAARARSCSVVHEQRPARPEAHRLPRGRRPAKISRAAQILAEEGIAQPILLGRPRGASSAPLEALRAQGLRASRSSTPRPPPVRASTSRPTTTAAAPRRHARTTPPCSCSRSRQLLRRDDGRPGRRRRLVSGLTTHYPDTIRPALQVIGVRRGRAARQRPLHAAAQGAGLLLRRHHGQHRPDGRGPGRDRHRSRADDREQLFDIKPRVAMISFSNFGNDAPPAGRQGPRGGRDRAAPAPGPRVRRRDAGRHGGAARVSCRSSYPFARLTGPANVLVFPDLRARTPPTSSSGGSPTPTPSARS